MKYFQSRQSKKNAFSRIGETCPAVEKSIDRAMVASPYSAALSPDDLAALATVAFEAARDAGTEPLREALINCEQEKCEVEEERDEALGELKVAKEEIEELLERIEHQRLEILSFQTA